MKGMFVDLVRGLRDPVRARRQEKIREVELTWSDHDLNNFRVFALGLQPAEMADVCYALADATATPLLELLVDYAEVNNDLMQIAFRSLEKAPLSARLFLAGRLFASRNPLIRASTCNMLAGAGLAGSELVTRARDDESNLVEAAAIRALARIGQVEAGEKIVSRLRGDSEEIRALALDAMTRLGVRSSAFEVEALTLFRNPGEKPEVRRKAALALAGMRSADGRLAMLAELAGSGRDAGSQKTAIEALAGYSDPEVVSALLRIMRGDSSALADAARQSLGAMDPAVTLGILRDRLQGGDAALGMVAAEILGGISSSQAGHILGNCLLEEKRPVLVASIADALGKSGHPGAWKVLYRKLKADAPDSLPLLAALADSASEENLDDFAQLLDNLPESGAGELILRRLAAFSRTIRPSPVILRRAVGVLDSGNRGLAIPAVEILAYSGEESVRERLLTEMAHLGAELPTRRLLHVMLKFKGGELAALFEGAGPDTAGLVAPAAAEAESMGRGGAEFFVRLASWVRLEAGGAREGLAAAAQLDPAQLVEAMRKGPDRVFLLEAWAGLGPRDRLRYSPDLDGLFLASEAKDRLFALGVLSRLSEERHLRSVATLAFGDRDPNVKAAAISLTRSLVSMDA